MKPVLPALALMLAVAACAPYVPSSRLWGTPMFVQVNAPPSALTGSWYEVGRFPLPRATDCRRATMTLAPQEDGSLQLTRQCTDIETGATVVSGGRAQVVRPGVLRVNSGQVLPANYWLLYLSRDGQMAVVGTPGRDTGFVLRRNAGVTPEQWQTALDVFERNNYDINGLQRIPLR